MNPNFDDPNNHVPEVNPGDDWGDEADSAQALPLPAKIPARKVTEDPNNPVPQVSAGDEWGDGEPVTILPKKRQADEKPAGFHAPAEDDKGVEIGVRVIEKVEKPDAAGLKEVQRLEVQEHVPKLLAPDAPPPPPKVVPKSVIKPQEEPPEGGAAPMAEWHGRTAESEAWGTEKKIPVRWIAISIAAVAVFVIAGVLILPKAGWKGERSVRTNYSDLTALDDGLKEIASDSDETSLGEGIEEKAKKLVETYATATSVEQVLPLVRDRERVEPALRGRWKPLDVPAGWTVPDSSEWALRKAGDREFGYLGGQFPDITPFRFYIVQKGDQALLDWEASTGFSETTFADLSKKKGDGGVTRCLISPGDLYTFSVPEEDYQCFRLGSPDGDHAIWGYVKRDSPLLEELTSLFVQGAIPREIFSEYPITLRLGKAPEESLPNQWMISEMLYLDWISP